MRNLVSSAAYRIAFTYSLAFALAITLLGVAVYFVADADFRRQQDAGIVEESAELIHDYRSEGIRDLRESIAAREAGSAIYAYGYALFDVSGHRIAGSLNAAMPPNGMHDIMFIDPVEGSDPARALTTRLSDGSRLTVALDPEALERIDSTIFMLFGGAFILIVFVGGAGALILGAYLRRRLGRISGTAHAIVAGDLSRRIPVGVRGDEFDQLAHALNAMLDRIALLLENLRQVSGDVAHDLRTPLARLRSELEAAIDGPHEIDDNRAALKRALRQSDDLLALFAAILRISEVEGGALAQSFEPVDVSALAEDLCESYAPAVSDGGRSIACEVEPGIVVRGDRELIAQALINLLDNAQRHTPPGTAILVAAKANDDRAMFTITDTGPGVAPEDRPRIVRRFVRLEDSRTTPGHGLGLNLVAAIASAHGGGLTLDDNGPGLRATIDLPRLAA